MNNEKYGIICYKNTCNLGDDIQTYATSRFLPKIDYVIDREKLSYFHPDKKEKVKVIMNGWYNHDKTQFLISPYINPLYISVHFSENDLILSRGYTYLDNYAKEVMSKYRIGCRDKTTLEILRKKGYPNTYFSSCLTTTIDPFEKKKTEDYIVAVDMNPKIVEHLRKIVDCKIIETTHWVFINPEDSYEEKMKKINEYDKADERRRAQIVQKHASLTFEERMKLVEKQLELYQNAKLVITDRIHVGLPCLGLKTNVLLIYYDYNKDRIETFKDFLTNCTEEEFLKMTGEELLKVKNKGTYLKYRDELIKTVKHFIETPIYSNDLLPDIEVFEQINIKREEYTKKMYKEKIKELKDKVEELKTKLAQAEKSADKYNKISSSRSWKIIGSYYRNKL